LDNIQHEDQNSLSKNNKTQPLPKQLIRVAKDHPNNGDYDNFDKRKPSAGAIVSESTQAKKKASSRV
jgi:hypothetical protein